MKGGNVCIELFYFFSSTRPLQPTLLFKIEPIGEYTYDKKAEEEEK